jgi:histone H1/5
MAVFFLAAAFMAPADRTLAEEPSTVGGAIGKAFDALNLRREPPPPADFVIDSRPDRLDYTPLAAPGSERRTKKKSPAELGRLEDELRAAAAANQRRAARVKTP